MTKRSASPAKPWSRAKAQRRELSPDDEWAARFCALLLAACHPEQAKAVEDPARRITLLVGRGGGKTTAKRVRALRKMVLKRRAKVIYFATTKDQARELNWEPLKDLIDKAGESDNFEFNESRMVCRCKRTGSTYKMTGADDKKEIEKYRGQPFDEVQIDEGASHDDTLLRHLVQRIVGPRLGERKGVLVIGGTPGHILHGLFYDATRPGAVDDAGIPIHRPYADRALREFKDWIRWSSHAWSLQGVTKLRGAAKKYPAQVALWEEALVEKAAQGWTDENPVWRREYLGEWARDNTENIFKYQPHRDGKPWNAWKPTKIDALGVATPPRDYTDSLFGYGLDLGSKDPFALNILQWSPTDPARDLWHVYCFELRGITVNGIARLLIGDDAVNRVLRGEVLPDKLGGLFGVTGWPVEIVADLAGLGDTVIDELAKVYGIKIKAAQKKDKFGGFEVVNGDFIDGRLHILEDSTLAAELLRLQWKPDENGQPREDKAQPNHGSDSLVYIRTEIGGYFEGVKSGGGDASARERAGSVLSSELEAEPPRRQWSPDEEDYSAFDEHVNYEEIMG